jgi:hypothetical protein
MVTQPLKADPPGREYRIDRLPELAALIGWPQVAIITVSQLLRRRVPSRFRGPRLETLPRDARGPALNG